MDPEKKSFSLDKLKTIICTNAYPPDSGGIAAFARDIFVTLENAGSRISVFKISQNDGNRVNNYWGLLKTLGRFFKEVKKEKPDLIICSRMLSSGLVTLVGSHFFRFKVIVQVHGTELRGRHKAGWRKWLLRKLYNNTDQIWANSSFTASLLKEYGCNPELIKIIYPFITEDAVALASSFDGKDSQKPLTIFTAATLYPRKGIDLVLKALANLKDLDWQYRIAGKPNSSTYEGFYEEMAAELGIKEKVVFLGQLERKQLWGEMANADIFVMPSRGYENDIESFGIVFIEAGLFSVPSIGTDIGGIKEAIGKGGIVIKDESIAELTQSIKYLMENQEARNELSQNALEQVTEKFTEQSRRKDIYEALAHLYFE